MPSLIPKEKKETEKGTQKTVYSARLPNEQPRRADALRGCLFMKSILYSKQPDFLFP